MDQPTLPLHAPPRSVRTFLSLLMPLLAIVCLLLLLLGLLAGGARWLLGTEAGTAWLLQQLPMVQMKNFRGALLGDQWRADSLRVEWAGGQQWVLLEGLTADKLRWQWRPHAYAWVALQADSLTVRKITVHTGPTSKDKPILPAELRAPFQLAMDRVQIDELLLEGQEPLRKLAVQGLLFDPRPGAQHQLAQFGFEGYKLAVAGQVRIANAQPYALAANASLRPLLDGDAPRWAAVVQAGGTAADLDLNATLRGRPLAGHEAPQADLRAGLRLLQPWPLARLDARTQALDLSALLAKAPSTRLSGQATLTGGVDKTPLVVKLELRNGQPGRWNEGRLPVSTLALELRRQLDRPELLELSRFNLALSDAMRSAGHIKGTAVWQGHDLALEMQLSNVTPQRLDGRAPAMTLTGPVAASLTGLPALSAQPGETPAPGIAWTLDLQGKLDNALQSVRLSLEGSADDQHLELKRAKAQSGNASAELTATVARAGKNDWRVVTQGLVREFDPLPWWTGEAGSAWRKGPHRFTGEWQFDVRLPGDADRLPTLTLAQRVAGNGSLKLHDSQLAGVPLMADVTLGYAPAAAPSPATLRAEFGLGGNQLSIDGRGDPTGAGDSDRWRVNFKGDSLPSLAPLLKLQPGLAAWAPRQGTALAAITADGRWPAMRSEGSVRVSQLLAGPLGIARATAGWRVANSGEFPQTLQLDAAGLAWGTQHADNLRAELRGTLAEHRIEVSGAMPLLPPQMVEQMLGLQGQTGTRALVVAQGSWLADGTGSSRYKARVERLVVGSWDGSTGTAPPASGWAEAKDINAELQFKDGHLAALHADAGRLRVGDSLGLRWDEVRVDLLGAQPQIQLRADLEPFALAPLLARAQPAMGWSGDLRLAAHIDIRAAEKMDAEVVFERHDGDLHLTGDEGTQLMGLTELRLAITAHEGLWNFTPTLRGRSIGDISGRVRVQSTPERRWPQAKAPIEGSVQLQVADIGIWSAWVPPGWRLAGEVKGTAAVSGTFGVPLYNGSLTANGLGVRNLLLGVNLSDGQLAVKLEGETAKIERFTLKGGDGTASITGGATLGRSPQAQLKLKAEHFRVLGRVDRLVVASGNLDLSLLSDQAKLEGKITLDEMLFDASRSDAPSLDDDVTVRRPGRPEDLPTDNAAPKAKYPWIVGVDIDMGDNARFRGWGLDTGLRGQLRLNSPTGKLAVVGTINAVNGNFRSYGQKLSIDRGIVAFSGALGNPYLDVLALRPNTDNMRVGVTLIGYLTTMRIRLYSEPELSENDKLAWLMLGRAPDSLGRNETALLQRAAVALLSGDGPASARRACRFRSCRARSTGGCASSAGCR